MELPELSDGCSESNSDSEYSQQSISSEMSYSSLEFEETANERLRMLLADPSTPSLEQLLDSPSRVPKAEASEKQDNKTNEQKVNERAAKQKSSEEAGESVHKKQKEHIKGRVEKQHRDAESDTLTDQHFARSVAESQEESDQSMLSFSAFAEDEEIPLEMKKTDTIAQLIKV